MTEHTFDIVILGGGSGGYAAALRAAELGKSVALIEKDKVGGTCLHRGCIPTKALLHSAEIAENVRDAAKYGIGATFVGIDPAGVRAYREGIVAKKYKGLEGLIKARGITVVAGTGSLRPDRSNLSRCSRRRHCRLRGSPCRPCRRSSRHTRPIPTRRLRARVRTAAMSAR